MKLTQIVESKQQLLEQHRRNGLLILVESTQGLNRDQRRIVEGIYKELLPLIEASLSKEQVQQLFGQIEQGATAAGGNRTMLGKGKDTVAKANEIINNVGKWLQDTTPVKAFDQKFEDLKGKISKSLGDDSKIKAGIEKMAQFAKENPGKTAAIIGVLTAIASIAGGPAGGAIAGQVLKGATELLKGEKLSTAIGKGAKAAALGWLTGKAVEFIGNALSAPVESAAKEMGRGIVKANYRATIDEIGGEFGNRFGTFATGELYGKAQDVADIKEVWTAGVDAWKAGDYLRSDSMFKSAARMAADLSDPEYVKGVASTVETAKTMMAGAKEMQKFFGTMADVAQGAATGAASNEPKKESKFYNTRPLSEGQVYMLFNRIDVAQDYLAEAGFLSKAGSAIKGAVKGAAGAIGKKLATTGKNLTTKVTADKLNSAWQKAGSPTDSQEVYDFLVSQGVDAAVIKPVYDTMKLPVPADTSQKFGTDQEQGSKEQPAADTPAGSSAQAPADTIGLQTQEPAQQGDQQAAQAGNTQEKTWKYKVPNSDSVYDVKLDKAGQLYINMDGEWDTVDDAADKKAIMDPANKVDDQSQASDNAEPAPTQASQVNIAKLAADIKGIQPTIVGDVKRMLDSDPSMQKKKEPAQQQAPKDKQPQQA